MRGSTPSPGAQNLRYGGNTSCVSLEAPGQPPILFDLGTGLRVWGRTVMARGEGPFQGAALVTHLHWDHIQGLPFFVPLLEVGSRLDVYGPPPDGFDSLRDAFDVFVRPPFFPVCCDDLPGEFHFHDVDHADVAVGDAKIRSRAVPHVGSNNGYRVDLDGLSVAYVPDHQQPDDPSTVVPEVLELCEGVDLLIHDAQFTPDEYEERSDWGHCTVGYAVEVAARAGVGTLALFHHDPAHDDDDLDRLLDEAVEQSRGRDIGEVLAASEGLTVSLG